MHFLYISAKQESAQHMQMATKCILCFLVPTVLLLCSVVNPALLLPPKTFDVFKYGAIANGKTDNSKAFLKAWDDACKYKGRSRVWIPKGTFLLGSTTFVGPCKGSMSFIVKGRLQAPTDSDKFFTDTWIGFRYLSNLTVKGGGVLDGQGHVAWPFNDCRNNPQCKPLPVSMRFDFIKDSKLFNLRSIDSKNTHFNVFACENLNISRVRIRAPAESPNTDGIRIGSSRQIYISRSLIATGDDCVSMLFGSRNIEISDVACGPGHGISIGSLGRSHDEHVTGISVRNCTFVETDNGVRIKTWDPSLYSVASDIVFKDIYMKNTRNPIIIDQQYNPRRVHRRLSAVQIKDVTFDNIWGTSSSRVAVNIQCSGALPCRNVKLKDIYLAYSGPGGRPESLCTNVFGSKVGKMVPDGCL